MAYFSTSLQERQWTIPLDSVVGTAENYGAAVDISQDLLVVYHNIRLTADIKVELLSLSRSGAPHSRAMLPRLNTEAGELPNGGRAVPVDVIDVQIVSQFLSLHIITNVTSDLEVWNWTSGQRVWNPTSTIVAVMFVVDSSPSHEDESTFILLIPYSTFGTRISKALLPPPSPVQGGQEYAWAEWGLSGSLLLTLCHPPSSNPPLAVHKAFCFPYGSRYPFLLCNSLDATSGDVVIFDLDPCVGRRAQSEADRDVDAVVKEISATPNPSWSTESLQTATPFATYRKVHVAFPENAIPRQVVMNHDGFSILYDSGRRATGRQSSVVFETFTV
ncbi:hypothetical protein C8Q76DRAFT_799673 [Earliella scabrosa]|nr:hypothetical protein C8Q76DRAFT_799673 [Earliella scabrosa]